MFIGIFKYLVQPKAFMGKKRGQAAFFIITGIVLVIIIVYFGVIKSDFIKERVKNVGVGTKVVPEQAQSVVNYVDTCIKNIAEEGIANIGFGGGYLTIPRNLNVFGRYLEYDENTKLPYWLFGEGYYAPPRLEDMEVQLEQYIDNRARGECSFDIFEEQGYNFLERNIISNVVINKDNVIVTLNSPLRFNIRDFEFNVRGSLSVNVNSKLGEMYSMALDILDRELAGDAPFEYNAVELLQAYSSNPNILPPTAGFEFNCGRRDWSKAEVNEVLRDILSENMIYLSIEESGSRPVGTDYSNRMRISNVFDENHDNVGVGFEYIKDWPIGFDIYPSEGDRIKADSLGLSTPFLTFCTKFYNFRYGLTYPLVVKFYDENGEIGLRFPMEIVIKDNFGRRTKLTGVEMGGVVADSLFCNENQRLSREVRVNVFEDINNPIEGAEVIFSCVSDECSLGKTDENGLFISRFPSNCDPAGELTVRKDNYLDYRQRLVTANMLADQEISVPMRSFKEINAKVKIVDLNRNERELGEDENVQVIFNKINENNEALGYDSSEAISFENNLAQKIKLVHGEYILKIYLSSSNSVTIEDIELRNGVLLGYLSFDWNIDEGELYSANELIFYALDKGVPRSFDELSRVNENAYDQVGGDVDPQFN